jgi:hypothetical protein
MVKKTMTETVFAPMKKLNVIALLIGNEYNLFVEHFQ